MELLWTDRCFLLMLFISVLALCRALRNEQTRERCKRLFHRPIALCSGIVLFFFILIATLDSLHLKAEAGDSDISGTAVSVLDRLMAPLDQLYEKTYSAPLALNLFTQEMVTVNGQLQQVYPRLIYPPKWIADRAERNDLLLAILLKSLVIALAVSALLLTGVAYCGVGRKPLLWGGATLCFCLFFIISTYWLSRYFHLFGTGKIGQDIFYYSIKSIRTGLIIGTLTTVFMLPLALIFGITAGYFGGVVDDVIQYIYTTLSSIPGVLLITASVLSMQTFITNHPEQFPTLDKSADARLLALCLILGVTSWTSLCRLLRAETLKLREVDYVTAARALGCRSWRIICKHLLPNVMSLVLITLVLDFSFLVLAEAVLSYVGVGVSPMTISWGNMINGARLELARDPLVWWPITAAFVFMFVLVLASNLFADAVRDALDPHQSL